MSRRAAWHLLAMLLMVCLVGALAPLSWYRVLLGTWPPVFQKACHILVFAFAVIPMTRVMPGRVWGVTALLVAFGATIEALQFLSPERQPSLVDIGIDLAGISLGFACLAL